MALAAGDPGPARPAGASGRPPLHHQSVAQARAFHVEDAPALNGPAAPWPRSQDRVVPGPAGELPVRVYTPEGEPPFPIVVFFHGGGWVVGTLDTYDPLCRALAAAVPAVVVSVGYRLAPEHRWPAAVEDAYAATLWASRNAAELGGAQHRLAVAGDSAGGNLAAVVALGARDRGGPQVAFQLLVYPVLDAAADTASWREHAEGFYLTAAGMRWYWDHYLGGGRRRGPGRLAAAGGLRSAGCPPALVIGAEHDILRDEGEAYAARLRDAGVAATASRYRGRGPRLLPLAGRDRRRRRRPPGGRRRPPLGPGPARRLVRDLDLVQSLLGRREPGVPWPRGCRRWSGPRPGCGTTCCWPGPRTRGRSRSSTR